MKRDHFFSEWSLCQKHDVYLAIENIQKGLPLVIIKWYKKNISFFTSAFGFDIRVSRFEYQGKSNRSSYFIFPAWKISCYICACIYFFPTLVRRNHRRCFKSSDCVLYNQIPPKHLFMLFPHTWKPRFHCVKRLPNFNMRSLTEPDS